MANHVQAEEAGHADARRCQKIRRCQRMPEDKKCQAHAMLSIARACMRQAQVLDDDRLKPFFANTDMKRIFDMQAKILGMVGAGVRVWVPYRHVRVHGMHRSAGMRVRCASHGVPY